MSATSPFRRATTLDALNALSQGTAMEPLGIVFTELGPDFVRGTMPVDARTRQPYGLLHGGASVLLAETLTGTARPVHVGRSTQVWEIRIEEAAAGRLVCLSRLTLAVIRRRNPG